MAAQEELIMPLPNWLPPLVLLEESNGDWNNYLTILYEIFKTDFIDTQCNYRGIKIAIKKHPQIDDKEATFWHLISEGENEETRTPDIRRCERIRWPKSVIEKVPDEKIKVYDKGVQVRTKEGQYSLLVDYRSGDMWAPKVEPTEAIKLMAEKFVDYVENGGSVINDGIAGLNNVKMLESAAKSIASKGKVVNI
mgnify:CR=1 FL=1